MRTDIIRSRDTISRRYRYFRLGATKMEEVRRAGSTWRLAPSSYYLERGKLIQCLEGDSGNVPYNITGLTSGGIFTEVFLYDSGRLDIGCQSFSSSAGRKVVRWATK